jgi:hypothetical protein
MNGRVVRVNGLMNGRVVRVNGLNGRVVRVNGFANGRAVRVNGLRNGRIVRLNGFRNGAINGFRNGRMIPAEGNVGPGVRWGLHNKTHVGSYDTCRFDAASGMGICSRSRSGLHTGPHRGLFSFPRRNFAGS